jgi:hypothetical protein
VVSTTLIFFADSLAREQVRDRASDQRRVEVLDDLDGVVERLADRARRGHDLVAVAADVLGDATRGDGGDDRVVQAAGEEDAHADVAHHAPVHGGDQRFADLVEHGLVPLRRGARRGGRTSTGTASA